MTSKEVAITESSVVGLEAQMAASKLSFSYCHCYILQKSYSGSPAGNSV